MTTPSERKALATIENLTSRKDNPWDFEHYAELKKATLALKDSTNPDMVALRTNMENVLVTAQKTKTEIPSNLKHSVEIFEHSEQIQITTNTTTLIKNDPEYIEHSRRSNIIFTTTMAMMMTTIITGIYVSFVKWNGIYAILAGILAVIEFFIGSELDSGNTKWLQNADKNVTTSNLVAIDTKDIPKRFKKFLLMNIDDFDEFEHDELGKLLLDVKPVLNSRKFEVISKRNEMFDSFKNNYKKSNEVSHIDETWLDLHKDHDDNLV